MPSNVNIEEYVRAAQSGHEAAWNVLYTYYYPLLYAAALKTTNDIHISKDAVQDAFVTAHLRISSLKNAPAFGAWIKKILVRNCYRAVYAVKNKSQFHLPVDTDAWWEDELNRKLDKLYGESRLYTTLAQLPEALRSTLLLRYFTEFNTYDEIANILSIPIGTVRSRLNQAKQKMMELWQQQRDIDIKLFERAQEWNHFYHMHFAGMHEHDNYKNQLVDHLQKDVCLTIQGGKSNTGKLLFENMIHEDREAGSWLVPADVTSCGHISIVETRHFNSAEHPAHCPPRSVLILYRSEGKVNKMNIHFGMQ